jgi:hypothetical protein
VEPTSGDDARRQTLAMPLQVDLAQTGAGVDPSPVLDHAPSALSERTHP